MEILFSSVAIFVLATSGSHRPKTENREYKYLDRRLIPMADTWGRFFPHLYFVFGTNVVDWKFTQSYCNETRTLGRRLRARAPQTKTINRITEYQCKPRGLKRKSHMNVLWVGNCTGEYFGIGPTCRCQEALRYFIRSPTSHYEQVEWFIFIDDDLYFRPYSLIGMLHSLQSNQPMQIVSSTAINSMAFAHRWDKRKINCNSPEISFAWAQPSIYNRAALNLMREGIDANGLTALQAEWGGSHDTLLGLFTWVHSIPQYSLHKLYLEGGLTVHVRRNIVLNTNTSEYLIFHKVRNLRQDWNETKLIGQYGLERFMYTQFLERNLSVSSSDVDNDYPAFEFMLGVNAALSLYLITDKFFNSTQFYRDNRFKLFKSEDCPKL